MSTTILWCLILHVVVVYVQCSTYTKKNMYCDCCVGTPGVPGNNGMPGRNGETGPVGPEGPKGNKGDMGNKGETGQEGPIGPQGQRGFRGKRGLKGACGPTGKSGPTGPKGERGQRGLKGSTGKTPPRVAFSASRTSKMGPVTEDTIITFDNLFTNIGEAFDIYTSHFVCRVNGTYYFTAHVLCNPENDAYAWIMLNGKHKIPMHADHHAGYGSGSNTVILHLLYDDHVWIQLSKNSSLVNDFSTFSGYLLYEDKI